jgi:hypothetical protein
MKVEINRAYLEQINTEFAGMVLELSRPYIT